MDIYEQYYLNDEVRNILLEEALIIFDTSALLQLYSFSDIAKNSLSDNIFKKLHGRLWLPAQIKFEFLKNKKKVSEKPINTYTNLIDMVKKCDSGHITKIKDISKKMRSNELLEIKNQLKTLKEKTSDNTKHPFFQQDNYNDIDDSISNFEKNLKIFEKTIDDFYLKFDNLINQKKKVLKNHRKKTKF